MKRAALLMAMSIACVAVAAEWPDLSRPPAAQGGGEKDAAVVIGVEDYAYVPHVAGAEQNAKDWYAYLTRTLKVPAARVTLLLSAEGTDEAMRSRAKEAAAQVKPGGTLWFVFVGHGAPAEDGKDGNLVGADAQQTVENLYRRSVRQRELLELLGKGAQARTVVVLDACFSGRAGTGSPIVEGLQPLLPVSKLSPAKLGKTVVMTAGAGNQFAGPLPGVKRPAFSYLVLGALRGWGDANGDGKVTAEEAVDYARDAIKTVVKDRRQTPELAGGLSGAVLATAAKDTGPDLVSFVLGEASVEQPAVGGAPAPEVGASGPSVKSGAVTAAAGDLTVSVKPKEGARLELTDPSGRALASGSPYRDAKAKVGQWKVVIRAAGYEEEAREFEVPADEPTLVKFELKLLGGLKVTGKPVGSAVKVTGPGGFANEGGLPWEASGLRSGAYVVEVTRAGYETAEQKVTVEAGKTATVEAQLVKKGSAPAAGTGGCPAGMMKVAGGSFKMGDRGDQVTVDGYCLDVTEVTVEAYASCTTGGKCSDSGLSCDSTYANWGKAGRGTHPINCVDWNQSDAYCKAQGKRLPTEEEWEWAARGGEKGTTYPWGNEAPGRQLCWDGEGSDLGKGNRQSTCPVGSYAAGDAPQGIHDLAGNVWEWTSTVYESGPGRVYRGGGWYNVDPSYLRAAFRLGSSPSYRNNNLGFRCARTP
jgi:formylglycine-generating enzyme required for sulfatase activity